jgi:hypothetical protein
VLIDQGQADRHAADGGQRPDLGAELGEQRLGALAAENLPEVLGAQRAAREIAQFPTRRHQGRATADRDRRHGLLGDGLIGRAVLPADDRHAVAFVVEGADDALDRMVCSREEVDEVDLGVVAQRGARQHDRCGKRRGGQGETAAADSAGHREPPDNGRPGADVSCGDVSEMTA